MPVYNTKIDLSSKDFKKNNQDMIGLIEKMVEIQSRAEKLSEERRPRFIERGQLTPRERMDADEFAPVAWDLYPDADELVADAKA